MKNNCQCSLKAVTLRGIIRKIKSRLQQFYYEHTFYIETFSLKVRNVMRFNEVQP